MINVEKNPDWYDDMFLGLFFLPTEYAGNQSACLTWLKHPERPEMRLDVE